MRKAGFIHLSVAIKAGFIHLSVTLWYEKGRVYSPISCYQLRSVLFSSQANSGMKATPTGWGKAPVGSSFSEVKRRVYGRVYI